LRLSAPRTSLSPSQLTSSAFKKFVRANDEVVSEAKVVGEVLPLVLGNIDVPHEYSLPLANLDSITDGVAVDSKPDIFDGVLIRTLDEDVKEQLAKSIIPTTHPKAPVAPNFFVEVKPPSGGHDVVKVQACQAGANGARAMFQLENFGADKPTHDHKAHAFSITYHAGSTTSFRQYYYANIRSSCHRTP
jgi:hypothetical protein